MTVDLTPPVKSIADLSDQALGELVGFLNPFFALRDNVPTGIPVANIATPGGTTTYLRADGTWASPAPITYRKTTSKTVNTTVAATDLLNGEVTVAAAALGATGTLRLSAWGDWLNNTGGNLVPPRFQLVFGGTTILDTGAAGSTTSFNAARHGWSLTATIQNANASSQTATMEGKIGQYAGSLAPNDFATGTGRQYMLADGLVLFEGSNSGLAVNTASACLLALNVINGSASASYETQLFGALVEVI